jgi:endonuclease/exonuclease/phosphatase family metal-dependent hydrolase
MRKLLVAVAVTAVVATAGAPAFAGAGEAPDGVRIVNFNVLHGINCPQGTEDCQAPDRIDLLARQLEAADCPDVVGLQETNVNIGKLVQGHLSTLCDGDYELAFEQPTGVDRELVLTKLPVKSAKVVQLPGRFRTATRVVLTSPLGPMVLVVTHQDGDPALLTRNSVCIATDPRCPPKVCPEGTTVPECQTIVSLNLADEVGGPKAIRVLMGDFNVTPTTERYVRITADWTDSHLAAGNAECDPATSVSCTAGREDTTLESLKDPSVRQAERIDFIFVKAPASCDLTFDPRGDDDGDGLGTGLWNDQPTLDGPNGIVWVSDHTATSADFTCA